MKQYRSRCFDHLTQQFQINSLLTSQKKQSLSRLLHYLCEVENIHCLDQIRSESFIQYIHYHRKNDFQLISFSQVIKDLKLFYSILTQSPNYHRSIQKIDFSLTNDTLWRKFSD